MPNWFASVTARAVAFQPVSESGYLTLIVALPSGPVLTSGCQKIVDRKSVRTCTAGSCWGASTAGAVGAAADKAAIGTLPGISISNLPAIPAFLKALGPSI